MKKNELNQQYYSLLSDLDKTASKHKLSDEISNVVYISDWVKIYLVGNIKNKQVSIQVEVVFSSFNHSDKERRLNLVLENQIQYLKYLKYLYDNGFTRLGCLMCPMTQRKNRLREAELYPKIAEAYKRANRRFYTKKERSEDDADRYFEEWLNFP